MEIKNSIMPSLEQLLKLNECSDSEPFHVLNLIKLNSKAQYADGRESKLTGAEAYALYGHEQQQHLREVGAEILLVGQLEELMIGQIEPDQWDFFAIVKYPNKSALRSFFSNPEWAKSNEHRVAGLKGQLLFSTKILSV